jgi:hypothetical protein
VSFAEDPSDGGVDLGSELVGFVAEPGELLVEAFELLGEVLVVSSVAAVPV